MARVRTIPAPQCPAAGAPPATVAATPAPLQLSHRPARTIPARPPSGSLDEERHLIRYHGRALDLSRYEYGVLRLLVLRPGKVFTRDELLLKVWGDDNASFDRTVDAHIKTLRAKLKGRGARLRAHPHLRGTGYALNEDLT